MLVSTGVFPDGTESDDRVVVSHQGPQLAAAFGGFGFPLHHSRFPFNNYESKAGDSAVGTFYYEQCFLGSFCSIGVWV